MESTSAVTRCWPASVKLDGVLQPLASRTSSTGRAHLIPNNTAALRSRASPPVARPAALVRDGDDQKFVFKGTVNHRVRKAVDEDSTSTRCATCSQLRVLHSKSKRSLHFFEKLLTEPYSPFLIVERGVPQFHAGPR